jgi:hypothetical protein
MPSFFSYTKRWHSFVQRALVLATGRPENPVRQTQGAVGQLGTGASAQVVVASVVECKAKKLHEFSRVQFAADERRSQERDAKTAPLRARNGRSLKNLVWT